MGVGRRYLQYGDDRPFLNEKGNDMTDESIIKLGQEIHKGIMAQCAKSGRGLVRPTPNCDWANFLELVRLEESVEGVTVTPKTVRKAVKFILGHCPEVLS